VPESPLQFPRLVNAVVEGLTVRCVGVVTPRLEQVSPLLREGDDSRVAVELNRANETGFAQVPELALPRVQGLIELVAEVARGDHTERAHRGQRARFRTAKGVVMVAVVDVFAVKSTWQIDVVRKHVAWIDLLALTRVRPGAAQIARVATLAGIVAPRAALL
jgi:hypothetical protein